MRGFKKSGHYVLHVPYTVGSFLVVPDLILFLPIMQRTVSLIKKKVYMKLRELSLIGWSFI